MNTAPNHPADLIACAAFGAAFAAISTADADDADDDFLPTPAEIADADRAESEGPSY